MRCASPRSFQRGCGLFLFGTATERSATPAAARAPAHWHRVCHSRMKASTAAANAGSSSSYPSTNLNGQTLLVFHRNAKKALDTGRQGSPSAFRIWSQI